MTRLVEFLAIWWILTVLWFLSEVILAALFNWRRRRGILPRPQAGGAADLRIQLRRLYLWTINRRR